MKYLMVVQPIEQYEKKEDFCMPLGIAYVNGAMRAAGYCVDGINLMFVEGDPFEELTKKIQECEIDVIMCGGLTSEYPMLKRVFETARKANPNIITVGGGGGFTSEPLIYSELTGVDYAVIGEGEITNCELAAALEARSDISQVQGIVYYDGKKYIQTEPRAIIEDIDSLPFPSYEGLAMEEYLSRQQVDGWYNYSTYYTDTPMLMPMMMSRSCPYHCSFCFHPIGNGYRARGIDNFFQELDMWVEKYHINGIALVDECFSMDSEKVQEFCRRIKPYHLAWACQMRAEVYNEEMIAAMKESGCIGACFGIESMSQRVLDNMRKHLKPDTIENALRLSYRYGVGVYGNLIFGAETETFDTVYESILWNRRHKMQYNRQPINSFNYIQTYPGSRYYDNAIERGIITNKAEYIVNGKWNLNITEMTERDYQIIGEVARLLQHETRDEGMVLAVEEQKDGRLSLTFRCPHCNSVHTYHNLRRKYLKEGRVRGLGCRTCNGMGDYLLKKENYLYDRYVTVDWLLGKYGVADLCDFFRIQGWKKIAIAGATFAADKLLRELSKCSDFTISCVVMRKGKNYIEGEYNFVSELPENLTCDILIDAEMVHFLWIQSEIKGKSDCHIVTLEDILRNCHQEKYAKKE
jgi:radical SAM superfamily enzyme YgiQ (UPF0313 family)